MVKFAGAAGSAAITKAVARTGTGRYTPTLFWDEENKPKYIQFLTDIEGFYTFEGHWMMNLGQRKDDPSKTQWGNFISPRDPHVDGADGIDLIADRFGLATKSRTFAIVVELEPITEETKSRSGKKVNSIVGFKPVMRKYTDKEKVEHEVPNVALICESPFTFFKWFNNYADDHDLSEEVFKVVKKGKKKDTDYYGEAVGEAVDLSEIGVDEAAVALLHDYIEDLASAERMTKLIGPLSDNHILDRYRQKSKSAASADDEPTVGPDSEPDADEPEGAEEDTPKSQQFATLSRRFAAKSK